jgi:DNA-directed RNA polymerase subunit RPC12/RpoP
MYCPNDGCPDYLNTGLRSEYRDDIVECPYCRSRLVHERPGGRPAVDGEAPAKPRVADDEEMEPVIESGDLTEIAVIKSLLDGAGIPYLTHGDEQFDAFRGAFVGGSLFNPRARAVVFVVPSRMAEETRNLLAELDETVDED